MIDICFFSSIGSITSLVKDVTDALGINTDDGGIGGVVGGALNLLSVGAGALVISRVGTQVKLG